MRTFNNPYKDIIYLIYRWIITVADPYMIKAGLFNFPGYFKDMLAYLKMKGSEPIKLSNTYPILYEKSSGTPFDAHYFYQDVWALNKINSVKPKKHLDISSKLIFASLLSTITQVIYVDYHPLKIRLRNFTFKKGDTLTLPFKKNSIFSLSCLNVAEHIGLGRYGDKLNPYGTKKACKKLQRILAAGGTYIFLYLSVNPDSVLMLTG